MSCKIWNTLRYSYRYKSDIALRWLKQNKRHLFSRPHVQAMTCLLWEFLRKCMCYYGKITVKGPIAAKPISCARNMLLWWKSWWINWSKLATGGYTRCLLSLIIVSLCSTLLLACRASYLISSACQIRLDKITTSLNISSLCCCHINFSLTHWGRDRMDIIGQATFL